MIRFRDIPIRRKLILVSMLTSMVALLLAVVAAISYELWRFRREIVPDISAQAQIIGENCAAALAFNDRKSAEEVLESLHARQEIVFACLFTADWKVFAQYAPRTQANLAELRTMAHVGHHFQGDRLILYRDVMLDTEILGHICLVTDLSGQYARVRTYSAIALVILAAALLVSMFFSAKLQRLVSQPILQLADVAREVTKRKDYALRANKESQDEVGELTDAFNQMLAQIQERDRNLAHRSAELQETNEALRTLIQTSPLAINALNTEAKIILWNQASEQMFGWSEKEVLGKELPILPEDQRKEFAQRYRATLDRQPVRGRELTRLRKDGSLVEVSLSTAPLRDARGNVIGTMGIMADITERKRAERRATVQQVVTQALSEADDIESVTPRILQVVCENLSYDLATLWRLSNNGREIRCRHVWQRPGSNLSAFEKGCLELRFEKGAGLPGQAWLSGQPVWVEDLSQDQTYSRAPLAAEAGIRSAIAFPILSGNRVVGVIELFSSTVRVPDAPLKELFAVIGSQIGLFIERRRAQAELHASEERFRQLAENIREVFWLSDVAKNEIMYVSPGYDAIWGRSRERLYTRPRDWLDAIHPEDRERVLQAALTKQASGQYCEEYRILRTDGSLRWIHDRAFPIRDGAGQVYRIAGIAEDITERRLAEAALRDAEEKWRSLVENSREIITILNRDGVLQYISRTVPGYDPSQVIGTSTYDYIEPQWHSLVRETLARVFERGEADRFELKAAGAHGTSAWYETRLVPIKRDGRVASVLQISTDITERKEIEDAMRMQSGIAQNMEEGVNLVRASDGRIVYTNPKFDAMFGYAAGELAGKHVSILNAPASQSAESVAAEMISALQKQGRWSGEIQNRRKDGSYFWCLANVSTFEHSGHGTVWIAVHTDITERKLAEERVRASEKRFRDLFESSPDAVFVEDLDGNVLDVNPAACRLHATTREELVGRNLLDLVPAATRPQVARDFRKLVAGEIQFQEGLSLTADGRSIPVSITASRIEHLGLPAALLHVRDITQRKRAEEQLQRAHEELKQSLEQLKSTQLQLIQAAKMESIGKLATNVAHEVKNPLAIAAMGLEYLTGSISHKNPEADSVLEDIKAALERADRVVHGLLDFSTPTTLNPSVVDLNELVEHTLSLIRHELARKHITLVRELAEDLPKPTLDENKIQQVVLNICMNSIQAMPGGGQLRVKTRRDLTPAGRSLVVVEVEDSGPGIPEDKLGKVFDPFFSSKSAGKGHGLGLSIAKQIVELHSGTIEVRNRPEGGAVVTMAFPQ